jgi:hypothetical protein
MWDRMCCTVHTCSMSICAFSPGTLHGSARPDTNFSDAAFGPVTTAQGIQTVKVNMNRTLQGNLRVTFRSPG